MKIYKIFLLVLFSITLLGACNKSVKKDIAKTYQCPMKCEGEKLYAENVSCPVCNMDLKPVAESTKLLNFEISDESIFNLTSKWNTEEGKSIVLKDLKGKTLVMVMIYTTCKAACPRLVADMRNIEAKIPHNLKKGVQYVMVSIDPKNDTPKRLKEFAIENAMDSDEWTFLQGSEENVREFANVLAMKYKQITPLDFSHSNIISVFNPQGELIHQQEGLGVDNKETITKIIETVSKK